MNGQCTTESSTQPHFRIQQQAAMRASRLQSSLGVDETESDSLEIMAEIKLQMVQLGHSQLEQLICSLVHLAHNTDINSSVVKISSIDNMNNTFQEKETSKLQHFIKRCHICQEIQESLKLICQLNQSRASDVHSKIKKNRLSMSKIDRRTKLKEQINHGESSEENLQEKVVCQEQVLCCAPALASDECADSSPGMSVSFKKSEEDTCISEKNTSLFDKRQILEGLPKNMDPDLIATNTRKGQHASPETAKDHLTSLHETETITDSQVSSCDSDGNVIGNPSIYITYNSDTEGMNLNHVCARLQKIGLGKGVQQNLQHARKIGIYKNQLRNRKLNRFSESAYCLKKGAQTCKMCRLGFHSGTALRKHVQKDHKYAQFSCPQCQRPFVYEHNLQVHLRHGHSQGTALCSVCGKLLLQSRLRAHLLKVHEHPLYACHTCQKGFIKRECLEGHMNKHSNTKPYICEHCGRKYTYSTSLSSHKKACAKALVPPNPTQAPHRLNKARIFICEVCGVKFEGASGLKDHLAGKHGDKLSYCGFCGKGFQWRPSYNRHVRNCEGKTDSQREKCRQRLSRGPLGCQYICVCGRRYPYRQSLRRHQKTCLQRMGYDNHDDRLDTGDK